MGLLRGCRLAALGQPLQPELADRLQHREAWLVPRRLDPPQQTLVDQRGDAVQEIDAGLPGRRHDRLRRVEREAAGEDGQAAEERLLRGVKQVVAPGDRVPHRPQPLRAVAGPGREHREPVRQPRQERLRRRAP